MVTNMRVFNVEKGWLGTVIKRNISIRKVQGITVSLACN